MRCISCIGSIRAVSSRFCRENRCIESDLVQEAIWHFWNPDEIILCISDPGLAPVAASCEDRGIQVQKLWIPEGRSEDDLWEIFTLLGGVVHDDEDILFDITGGCQTLPFIIALVAIYLRDIRKVRVTGIVYAPQADEFGLRHFVDLRSVMSIADWIAGMKALSAYTDASPLHALLNGLQGSIHRSNEEADPPTHLIGWSHLLMTFTTALSLSRPVNVLYAGYGINQDIPVVTREISRYAPSLLPIMGEMNAIRRMGALPPENGLTREYLMLQHAVITYQVERGLVYQAASLSREWLISATMLAFRVGDRWLEGRCRHVVSRTLTGRALVLQGKASESTVFSDKLLELENNGPMVQIWERVSDLRNDLAHCGMNERDESIGSILKRTAALPVDTMDFARYAGLWNPGERDA
jgi:hypothetical protein